MEVVKSNHASLRVHGCAFAFQTMERIFGFSAYEELTFDIFFTPMGKKKIFVENLPYGCTWSLQNVRDAVDKATPSGGSGSFVSGKSSKKKVKRTVKIYPGGMIKQGMDGITYVPINPPHRIRKAKVADNEAQ